MNEANRKSNSRFWHVALAFVLVLLVIIASAGSINYGSQEHEALYAIAGALNLGWLYPVIRETVIYLRKNE